MIFSVEKTLNSIRLGVISGIERMPGYRLETPNLFVYMKGGIIPYITPDIFEEIGKENRALYFPLAGIIHSRETMTKFSGSIGEFVGMPDCLTFVSVVDSGVKQITGYNVKDHVPVWSRAGKVDVNVEDYVNFIEALKPDIFLTLSDTDTKLSSSKKRVSNSLERSSNFFEKFMKLYKESEKLKESKIIGSLVGGFNVQARENFSSKVGKSSVFGVSIDGLHDCCNEVSEIDFELIKPAVESSLKHIPCDKLRICHGSWNPKVVLDLISLGVDIFDTSFPCLLAESGGALTFLNDESIFEKIETSSVSKSEKSSEDLDKSDIFLLGPVKKKPKMELSNSWFHISLRNKEYAECLEPISKCCSCLTCKNHTKAYIHHLLNVKEILGVTLVMIHNLHHYFQFFKTIRTALKQEKFEIMKSNFETLFDNDDTS